MKLARTLITDINAGDIFDVPNRSRVMIGHSYGNYWDDSAPNYFLMGIDGVRPFNCDPKTKQEMIDYLNEHRATFICNINHKIATLIADAK
jgi:hypothetical protein